MGGGVAGAGRTLYPGVECPLLLQANLYYEYRDECVCVCGGGALYPWVDCPPLPQVNYDYVHRDEIGEIVSSILLKGFQKLQITRLLSIPFIVTKQNERVHKG